ncbi:MAG: trypsin-like peptidase domain-containing protein [Spirochaetia bacterium]
MKRRNAGTALVLILLAGCAGAPRPPAPTTPLPQARADEIRTMISGGSYLQALVKIDGIRRQKVEIPDLESFSNQAIDSFSRSFKAAIDGKNFQDALRLLDSARALGQPQIAGTWTEKSLLGEIASAQEAAGDTILGLLTRLHILSLGDPVEQDYTAALADANTVGNMAVVRSLASAMKERGFAVPASADAEASPSFPRMISGTVTILVDRGIKVEKGVGYPDKVIGSGFFIDKRGYLLTNHHVIESEVDPKYKGYSRLYVRLSESPVGERIPAKVVGYDKTFDLALIKTEITPDYVFGGWSGQTLTPGDRIYAIGSPAGLEKTITSGIISAMGRRLLQVGDSMQVDVPLNPGNSGGPLLNERGDLIGIVFAGMQQFPGLNFAVPYTWVEKALPALFKGGPAVHSWLGMAVAETEKGLEVVYSMPDEPAAQAGIASGDIIETLDGKPFKKLADIQEEVLRHSPPSLVTLRVRRGETSQDVLVCLSARPDEPIDVALKRDSRDNILYPLFGMKLENVGTFLWKGDYIVKRVTQGSIADESGISPDDPLTIQDWQVDQDKGYAMLQVVIKKKKAGFLESAIQIATYLETDNFI